MSILVRQLQPFDPERRLATSDDYQLLWVTRGNAEVKIDFESHRATAGCFYFWAPRRAGGWTRSPDFSGWELRFSIDFLDGGPPDQRLLRTLGYFHTIDRQPELKVEAADRSVLELLFLQLESETGTGDFGATVVQKSLLRILLVTLQRKYPDFWAGVPANATRRLVEEYCLMVSEEFLHHRQIADYASRLGVTPDHLAAWFRKLLKFSPSQLIQNHLVLEAKRLLTHTGLTIGEISNRLRFADQAYFSRFFRKLVGRSPTDFRQSHPE
jgi:AraC-like DNA-binding protein